MKGTKEIHNYLNDYPLAVENTHFDDSEYMSNVAQKLGIKKSNESFIWINNGQYC